MLNQATDPWSRVGVVGKAALIAIGPFVASGLFSMGSVLPRLGQEFASVPNAALLVQLIGSIVAPVFALASPLAGRLINRFGLRTVYMVSVVLMAIGGAGPALCNDLTAILALRVLLAIGVAGGLTAGMSGIARLPEGQRATVLGLNSFFGGAICLPLFPIVGMLAEESWRLAFLTHLILLVAIPLALALPGTSAARVENAHSGVTTAKAGLLAGLPVILAIVTALSGLAMVASSMYTPFLLASIGVTEPAKIGQLLAIMSLFSLAGSGSYGFMHKRLGTQPLLKLGLVSMAIGCLVIAIAPNVVTATAGMSLLAIGLAVYASSAYAAAIESAGSERAAPAAMGVLTFCLYGSQMAFPFISGQVGESAGPAAVFMLLAGLMVLGLVLTFALHRRQPTPAPA